MGRRAPPPLCSRRSESSWRAALLAASILNSCFPLTQSQGVNGATQIPVTWEPLRPLEGQSLTLTPGGSLDFLSCKWYRGGQVDERKWIFLYFPAPEQKNGPAYTGRETGGPNCSLLIKRMKSEDTGNYTVSKAISGPSSEIGVAYIIVLGSRALTKDHVIAIVVCALCAAVLIGFLLYCVFCGCCLCRRSPPRRYPPSPYDLRRRHTA